MELFEPDLVAAPESPEEIAALATRLGLSLDLYQPFRDAEGVTEDEFARVLRRARAKFELMQRLGIDTMLVCSNVATATVDDDEVSAGQLRRLGELAAEHGVRIAYEALAWGTYVDDYRRSWRIVELADHDAVGALPGQLPHPVPWPRPRRHRGRSRATRSSTSSSRTRRT